MATANLVHSLIAPVCPIVGVSGPQPSTGTSIFPAQDGSLWRIDFDPSATVAQQQAAKSLLASTNTTTLTPPSTAMVWQLHAVMSESTWTGPTWAQVTTAVQNSGNATLIAFFTNPGNVIPSNSTTLAALGTQLGMTSAQITRLVQQASAISLP